MYYTQGHSAAAQRTFPAMRFVTWIKRAWAVIGVLGNAAWIFSLGGSAVISAVLTNVLDLHEPWQGFFFIGCVMVLTALILPFARAGFAIVGTKLPQSKPKATATGDGLTDWLKKAANEGQEKEQAEQEANERVAIHEVITTLRHHRQEIQNTIPPRANDAAGFQGEWPESRKLLARRSRYDRALRLTEEAFQAVWVAREPSFSGFNKQVAATHAIDEAVKELNEALPRTETGAGT